MPGANTKWEYHRIHKSRPCTLTQQELDALGEERWEMCGVIPFTGSTVGTSPSKFMLIFKREKIGHA